MIEGEAREWSFTGDSGNMKTRGFCPGCGSPLYLLSAASPQMFTIHAGSLDDPEIAWPEAVIWTARAPSWACIDDRLPRWEGQPPPIA